MDVLLSKRKSDGTKKTGSVDSAGASRRLPGGGPAARPARRRTTQGRAAAEARIGVLSDTHGYLDPEILRIFAGVDHIIHAGDVMDPGILTTLATVAPVTAVSGNLDDGELSALPREATGDVGGIRFVVAHKPKRLLKRLAAGKVSVGKEGGRPQLVVWGHLHTPTVEWVEGELRLNPGTASSPDEEDDGPTVAIVESTRAGLAVQFVPLRRRPAGDGAE